MNKAKILTIEGKESKEISLPSCFNAKIREDISQKVYETEKIYHPYAPSPTAGKRHSASGKLKKTRKAWKTSYGKGISRVPRKIFWRRGNQFYWVAAEVASTRGGRRAHPPKIAHFLKKLKINNKEKKIAMDSVISATANISYLKKRYELIKHAEKIKLPVIIESKILNLKAKEFLRAIKNILGENARFKGKNSKGILFVIGSKENYKFSGIDIRKTNELEIADLYPLGRLALYTENAISDLGKINESEGRK